MMVVGTYTDGGSKGVYSYRFNQETGVAEALNSLEMVNENIETASEAQAGEFTEEDFYSRLRKYVKMIDPEKVFGKIEIKRFVMIMYLSLS